MPGGYCPIDAIIFDFDGLILDTEGPDYSSWAEVYREHGAELTISAWSAAVGTPSGTFDVYGHLAELSGRDIDRVYLTHLYPHTEGRHDEMLESVGRHFDGDVRVARDGLRFEL